MPNYCNFSCRVTGPKKGIDRFIAAAQTPYTVGQPDEPEHFWRVFELYIDAYKEIDENLYQLDASGYCAWSVHSCFLNDGYQSKWDKDYPGHKGITAEQISAEENLVVEFYSDEIGMGFSEHIVVVFGEIYTDDTVDYTECDSEMNYTECNERSGNNWTKEQWDEYFKKEDYYICCSHNWEFTNHTKHFREE